MMSGKDNQIQHHSLVLEGALRIREKPHLSLIEGGECQIERKGRKIPNQSEGQGSLLLFNSLSCKWELARSGRVHMDQQNLILEDQSKIDMRSEFGVFLQESGLPMSRGTSSSSSTSAEQQSQFSYENELSSLCEMKCKKSSVDSRLSKQVLGFQSFLNCNRYANAPNEQGRRCQLRIEWRDKLFQSEATYLERGCKSREELGCFLQDQDIDILTVEKNLFLRYFIKCVLCFMLGQKKGRIFLGREQVKGDSVQIQSGCEITKTMVREVLKKVVEGIHPRLQLDCQVVVGCAKLSPVGGEQSTVGEDVLVPVSSEGGKYVYYYLKLQEKMIKDKYFMRFGESYYPIVGCEVVQKGSHCLKMLVESILN